jgi:hypothetical protein
VTAQPSQEQIGYDVFFNDHLWHFGDGHIAALGAEAGLAELARLSGQGFLSAFSLHVFSTDGSSKTLSEPERTRVRESIRHWRSVFAVINRWLLSRGSRRPLAVWGVGQTFQLMRAYTNLGSHPIAAALDDNPRRFAHAYSFPVGTLEATELHDDSDVLLTFAATDAVVERLSARGLSWFAPLT